MGRSSMLQEKIVIDSKKRGVSFNFKEIFRYKDLFLVLAWRDLRVRYAQTFLGLFWSILQPVFTLLIFTLIFGKALNVDTESLPYPVYALSGMSAWAYFSFVLNQSGTSIIGAQEMIKKVYFPRLIIPLSKAMAGFVDFLVSLMFLGVLMLYYQVSPGPNIFYFPLFFLLNVMIALGVGIWTSALTIRFRDFQHVIPFVIQIGLYSTPIAYPASLIPEKYQLVYHLNPMVGVVEGFRYSLLGLDPPGEFGVLSLALIPVIFISSLFYFKKVERVMADLV
jgi:homopolymeric O-antigen transport system permease protein